MTCLPSSGGCERRLIDPFVDYLNSIEGVAYKYVNCPDQENRSQAQPDGLYADAALPKRLAIERKTLLWPLSYAEAHQADHFLMDLILDALKSITNDAPYELELYSGISLDRSRLKEFAWQISEQVKAHLDRLTPGCGVEFGKSLWWYRFTHQKSEDRDYTEPSRGLKISLVTPSSGEIVDPSQLMTALCEGLQKCFWACERKFQEYADDRKILLIDPHGELRHLDVEWWGKVLCEIPRPFPLSEIWLGMFDMVSDIDEGWIFEKVYPFDDL